MSRKLVLLAALIIVLVGTLGFPFPFRRVEAGGTIYIRANGDVEGTDKIERDGDLYTFTDNINDSIVVERDNIVIDGANHTLQGTGSGIGLNLTSRSNVAIKNVEVTNFRYGIWLESSSNNVLADNIVHSNNWAGVQLSSSSNHNTVSINSITNNNQDGVAFYSSSFNTISGNNIASHNRDGIAFYSLSNNNTVSINNITNSDIGVRFDLSSLNTVSGNNIINNGYGVFLWSSNHKIYHNNFINNTNQAGSFEPNTWDDGYPSGGNYWSNYTGIDLDHDGIGDSWHEIDENNTDHYPLVGMFSSFNTSLGYDVNVISNSTIENFEYFEENSTIRMYVSYEISGIVPTFGFCRVCISHILMDVNNISVIIDDGLTPVLHSNYTLYDNGTHGWIYFAYERSAHKIDIIPEFPSFLVLPLFMIATLLAVIVYGRKHSIQCQ